MLSIDLNGTKIGDAVLESIGQNIPNLQNLQLVGTSITDQSLKVIAEFKHLRTLAISSCRRLSPEATRKLASCQNLESLIFQDLNLANDDLLFLKQLENYRLLLWAAIRSRKGAQDNRVLSLEVGEHQRYETP